MGTSRFFDAATGGKVQLDLQLHGVKDFQLLRPFGYKHPRYADPFIVPADPAEFRTDLVSVPWVFGWLVPTIGVHLLAALLHDGLVVGEDEAPTHLGPPVDRVEADRIFRDAMKDVGTPRLRRWLIWTAVVLATSWSQRRLRWWWRTLVIATFGTIAVLGVIATLDVVDVWDVLPWMGDRSWWAELAGGALFAVLVPAALSVLWLARWKVAVIGGVALAFLLHVSIAVAVVYCAYWLAERVISASERTVPDIEENLQRQAASSRPVVATPR